MKEEIIKIIVDITGDDTVITDSNVDLIETDILDSLAFINLIEYLEEKYNIEIEPTEIPYATWTSIDNIVKMVEEKLETKN